MHIRSAVEPMLGRLVDRLPGEAVYADARYEPKWDGYRCIARVAPDGVVWLTSRRRNSLKTAFPEITTAVHQLVPPATVLDGEVVRWAEGRLDFAALQRRHAGGRGRRATELAATEPCHYVVFDVLELAGEDLRTRPLSERRQCLERLFADFPGTSPLQLSLHTSDRATAEAWFDQLAAVGVEGLVLKPAYGPYRPGSRGDWLKIKRYTTTEAIVGGVTGSLDHPAELILGRYTSRRDGELIIAGHTTPLSDQEAAEIAAVVTPAINDEHPWPATLPASWHRTSRSRYVRVTPAVVVEVRVDVATHGQRWRHGLRYLRLRPELDIGEVPHDLDIEAP